MRKKARLGRATVTAMMYTWMLATSRVDKISVASIYSRLNSATGIHMHMKLNKIAIK